MSDSKKKNNMKRILLTIFIVSLLFVIPSTSVLAVENNASVSLEIQVLKLRIQILELQIQKLLILLQEIRGIVQEQSLMIEGGQELGIAQEESEVVQEEITQSSSSSTPQQEAKLEITSIKVTSSIKSVRISVRIEWQTNVTAKSKVLIPDFITSWIPSTSGFSKQHAVDIDGLKPGTNYFYEIGAYTYDFGVVSQGTQRGEFKTSSLPPPPPPPLFPCGGCTQA